MKIKARINQKTLSKDAGKTTEERFHAAYSDAECELNNLQNMLENKEIHIPELERIGLYALLAGVRHRLNDMHTLFDA